MSSTKPKLSPSVARKIKVQLGEEAYEEYKRTGVNPLEQEPAAQRSVGERDSGRDSVTTAAPAEVEAPKVENALVQASNSPRVIQESIDFGDGKVVTPEADKVSMEDLKKLEAGDLIRNDAETRFRVQKNLGHGLRIRDTDGARDVSWSALESMGPWTLIERSEDGPAARRLGDLRKEAQKLGIDTDSMTTVKEITAAMGAKLAEGRTNVLDQIDPMLAADDPKKEMDYSFPKPWRTGPLHRKYWDNPQWAAEEKIDGVRIKLHFTPTGIRADSRRPDTKTRLFSEKTQNFGHINTVVIPELLGLVLDTEAIIPVKSGVLPSGTRFYGYLAISTATCNAGVGTAADIQERFGPMQFFAFDILRTPGGHDTTKLSFKERRDLLEAAVHSIGELYPESKKWLFPTRIAYDHKVELYEEIIGKGGEGVILKKLDAPYQQGKRPKVWQKVKRFQEVDAYVTGYVPGKEGNEGLVGALELSVLINGLPVGVAAVSQVTLDERKEMTAPDGSLKPEYYKRVVTFRGQELTKNGRFRHAVFVTWREDKTWEDCDGYEIIDELKAIGI